MITINLYDYKRVVRDVGIQKNLWRVFLSGGVVLVICLGIWIIQGVINSGLESDLAELQAEVAKAKPDYDAVQTLKKRRDKYNEIITGINALRSQQAPTTQLLEDVGLALPKGVWLTGMKQMNFEGVAQKKVPFLFIDYSKGTPKENLQPGENPHVFIQIRGTALNDQPIIHLLEQLRTLPYFDAVVLNKAKRDWIEVVPVQEFEIYCHFLKPEAGKAS